MTCIFELLIGILLLINPVGFTSGIIIAFGLFLTAAGILSAIQYFRTDAETASRENGLAKGMTFALLGLFCVFKSEWFLDAFPLLTILYGILMLVCGICKVQWAVDMLRAKQQYWYIACISAAVTVACAALILANPFTTTAALWVFIGVTMTVEAILDFVTFIFRRK